MSNNWPERRGAPAQISNYQLRRAVCPDLCRSVSRTEIAAEPINHSVTKVDLVRVAPNRWRMTFAPILRILDVCAKPAQSYENLIAKKRSDGLVLRSVDNQQRRFHSVEIEER